MKMGASFFWQGVMSGVLLRKRCLNCALGAQISYFFRFVIYLKACIEVVILIKKMFPNIRPKLLFRKP